MEHKLYYRIREAAALVGVNPMTIRRACWLYTESGGRLGLPFTRPANALVILIRPADLTAWAEGRN